MTSATRLQGLAPVMGPNTRLLVLGSFPGVASLQSQRYYGHPQNQFWRILGELWSLPLHGAAYEDRIQTVREKGLGMWDVYASCERHGSLDANIRVPVLNNFAWLQEQCPRLQAVAHNGGESFRHARHTRALGLPVYRLPSTSPANAGWSFERKLQAWREVFQAMGL